MKSWAIPGVMGLLVGVCVGVILHRPREDPPPIPAASEGMVIVLKTDMKLPAAAMVKGEGEGEVKNWEYRFRNHEATEEAWKKALIGIREVMNKELWPDL